MKREYHQPCRNKKDKKTLWRNICQNLGNLDEMNKLWAWHKVQKLTKKKNNLTRNITSEETKLAVWKCLTKESLGLHGYTTEFFQIFKEFSK